MCIMLGQGRNCNFGDFGFSRNCAKFAKFCQNLRNFATQIKKLHLRFLPSPDTCASMGVEPGQKDTPHKHCNRWVAVWMEVFLGSRRGEMGWKKGVRMHGEGGGAEVLRAEL